MKQRSSFGKRVVSLLMALTLLQSLAVPALAAGTGSNGGTTKTYSAAARQSTGGTATGGTATGETAIDSTNFPDDNSRKYVSDNFDIYVKDGKLSKSELDNVIWIDLGGLSVSNAKGVEYFTNLTGLNCSQTAMTALDVSKNTKLNYLVCHSTKLSTLDVTMLPDLEYLECCDNNLTTLDVTKNPKLTYLNCWGNQITELDLSNCPKLESMYASGNPLTSLNAAGCSLLPRFNASLSSLTYLNVTGCSALEELYLPNSKLTGVDLSDCSNLKRVNANQSQLTTLDVSHNQELTMLYVAENKLTELDVTHNAKLEQLDVYKNPLSSLDVSHNPELTYLDVGDIGLTELDVTHNPKLKQLYAYFNKLSTIDVSHNPELTNLTLNMNDLTELNVDNNTKLQHLTFIDTKVSQIDVSMCPELNNLQMSRSLLTELDVSHNPQLRRLNCSHNQLTVLDLSKNTKLAYLNCSYNRIENVPPCPAGVHADEWITQPQIGAVKVEIHNTVVVTPELKKAGFTTVQAINTALKNTIKTQKGFENATTVTMEVDLYITKADGTVEKLTPENFPKGGMDIVLPYPEGADRNYNYMISHMMHDGTLEVMTGTAVANGIIVHVSGASPFGIAYTEKSSSDSHKDNSDYTIKSWVTTGGMITPSATVKAGDKVTFTITPNSGYRIVKVVVDGVDVGPVSSYTFFSVNRDHEIGAYFDKGGAVTATRVTGLRSPATGDESSMMLWVVLLAVAAVGMVSIVVICRKKQK